MAKKILKAETTVGCFSRASETEYKFVKVWSAPRFERYRDTRASTGKPGHWHKNKGFEVTWHQTRDAAERAKCKWVSDAVCVGIFPVESIG
jgi:hypothetical protein